MPNHLSHVGAIDAAGNTSQQIRDANDLIREGLRHADPDYKVAFLCECEEPSCYAAVWLTCSEYEERRARSQPVVVPGHRAQAAAEERR
jgi:hypothetical protein